MLQEIMSSPSIAREDPEKSTKSSGSGPSFVEPNVFRIPHSRMKELVSWPLKEAAAFPYVEDIEPSLQAVYEAMWEVKSHEYIENHYIMDHLKARLQAKQVYNELVCNCHEDSILLEVIELVENVYTARTQTERCAFGRKLQRRIRTFLDDFVAHMEQEEAVFQPLLVQNFELQELAQMKEKVIEQHNFFREKIKGKKLKAVKRKLKEDVFDESVDFTLDDLRVKKSYCQEVSEHLKTRNGDRQLTSAARSPEDGGDDDEASDSPITLPQHDECNAKFAAAGPRPIVEAAAGIDLLPEELLMTIFSHLGPKDLLKCSAVCKRWNRVALSSTLWKAIYPTQWARGCWSLDYNCPDLEKDLKSAASSSSSSLESLSSSLNGSQDDEPSSDESSSIARTSRREEIIFRGIVHRLLPKIGFSISTLILSASKVITSQQVKGMLKQVLNVRHVDLSYTNVTSQAFAGLNRFGALRKLTELDLAGCRFVGDNLLHQLGLCYHDAKAKKLPVSHLAKLVLSGCRCVTSWGIAHLAPHQSSLQELDLSGCFKIDGDTLSAFVKECPKLKPQKLSYCNDIEDGPYPDTADGCLNLECEVRFCCQNSKLRF